VASVWLLHVVFTHAAVTVDKSCRRPVYQILLAMDGCRNDCGVG